MIAFHDVPRRLQLMYEQEAYERFSWPASKLVYSDSRAGSRATYVDTVLKWDEFCGMGLGPHGNVFIHQRQAPGRPMRVVAVSCADLRPDRTILFYVEVLAPGTILHRPELYGVTIVGVRFWGNDGGIRVFGGQADPANSRHFTIAFDHGGKSGIIDGWLEPDDSVKLEPRP
ncbi:MAG TPA: hypothetical protein VHY37_09140 [Tepidisphaeraceae bacterium]|jgi:hypothetical protein|nr:hypothetical protein [Tepidisphaeraceae bacterium]